jgi:bifunctional DNase/RNase
MAMQEVEVARLGLDRSSNTFVVILREKRGERVLPIWIGQAEAESIVVEMHQIHRERPLTHDLCKSIITELGATLTRVRITRIVERTYHAELHIAGRDGGAVVDARPSDSIALALRFDAPIFAAEELLAVAIQIDTDPGSEIASESESAGETEFRPMSPEELKAYLENLRPEDFGKFRL